MKSRQKVLLRAKRANENTDLAGNEVLSDNEAPFVIQLNSKVNFCLV